MLQEVLRVPLLVVWARHVAVLWLVRVCIFHGYIAVAVVVVRASTGGAGGGLDAYGALARG